MKRVFMFLLLAVSIIVLSYSCSAPADSWSCSKLRKEIAKCEQNIKYSRSHLENYEITRQQYDKNVKAFRESRSHIYSIQN